MVTVRRAQKPKVKRKPRKQRRLRLRKEDHLSSQKMPRAKARPGLICRTCMNLLLICLEYASSGSFPECPDLPKAHQLPPLISSTIGVLPDRIPRNVKARADLAVVVVDQGSKMGPGHIQCQQGGPKHAQPFWGCCADLFVYVSGGDRGTTISLFPSSSAPRHVTAGGCFL